MSVQTWVQALITAQVAGGNLTNSTTATSLLPSQAKFSIPANTLAIGTGIRVTMIAQVSNTTTAGTLTLDLRHSSTIVFNGGTVGFSTTNHTTLPGWWEVYLTCRTIGSTANYMGQGRLMGQMFLSSGADLATMGLQLTPNTTPAVGNNFDSTAPQLVDLFATWGTALAGDAIQLQQYILELLN